MEAWATLASQLLVRTALAAIPLALLIAAVCRWLPARPATRHSLWLVLIAWFLVSPFLPGLPLWNLVATKLAPVENSVTAAIISTESLPEEVESIDPIDVALGDRMIDDSMTFAASPEQVEVCRPKPTLLSPTFNTISGSISNWLQDRIEAVALAALKIDHASVTFEAEASTADAADAVEPEDEAAAANETNRWTEWSAYLLVLRDAVTRIPTLPPSIVFGGIAMLCSVHGVRMLLFHRRLRRKIKTPQSVIKMVERCARRIGLDRMPLVQMTPQNVSPMIWCGWRTRLILPAPLWLQLDDVGREAIVCHELAHLRRRDHWWCWGDLIAGTLYWWHPLVWWVRKRLHEEAELSCDAWVIWLLPHGRRAYAEALLRTNESVARTHPVGPAVGMAVASGRTRQFARRLTMVMTESTRPRVSLAGLALAGVIAAASWAAVPARSCPPESSQNESQPVAVEVIDTTAEGGAVNLVVAQPGALPIGIITNATACPDEESTPKAKASRGGTGVSNSAGGNRNLGITGGVGSVVVVEPDSGHTTTIHPAHAGHRSGPAHDRVAELERRVAELGAQIAELNARMGHAPRMSMPRTPQPPRAARAPRAPAPPRPSVMPALPATPAMPAMPAMPRQRSARPTPRGRIAPSSGAMITRSYKLPKGKLDAMWELMSRSDVPTTVRSIKGGIEVIATEAQHEVFEAFIRLINPQGSPTPRADASPRNAARSAEVEARAHALRERVRTTEERTRAAVTERKALQKSREKHAEQLFKQAEKLRSHAESMRDQTGDAEDNETGKARAKSLNEHAKDVENQAKTLEQQMRALEREARSIEKLSDALEGETDALGCLRETLASLQPNNLAELLGLAARLEREGSLNALTASFDGLSETIEHDIAAKLEKELESVNLGDPVELIKQSKVFERLCETLQSRAEELDARAEAKAEEDSETKSDEMAR